MVSMVSLRAPSGTEPQPPIAGTSPVAQYTLHGFSSFTLSLPHSILEFPESPSQINDLHLSPPSEPTLGGIQTKTISTYSYEHLFLGHMSIVLSPLVAHHC